jgi:glycine/D-amino acid oxidase-like deaminating enzyme
VSGLRVEADTIAVIGAGVIGCALAWALAREGRHVLLIDRADPGTGGASFGNAGQLGTQLVEPVPSPQLLFGFWSKLFAFGGPLSISAHGPGEFTRWASRFAVAAFRQRAHTRLLAPLVRPAAEAYEAMLRDVGRLDLLRRNGHYHIWIGARASAHARTDARNMAAVGVRTERPQPHVLQRIRQANGGAHVDGLWFPDSGHVLDPLSICRVLAEAAFSRGSTFWKTEVRALAPRDTRIEVITGTQTLVVSSAIVCAGAWSAPLLAPFAVRAPLQAARGYHIELPGHDVLVDAPIFYMDRHIVVTPMQGRLRATSFMEFASPEAAPDPRKPAWLRRHVARLGYACEPQGASWVGPRPALPDYLPGIGRARDFSALLYAVGHQHIGLTLAPVTAELMADVVAGRTPRLDIRAFDLHRFGSGQINR